MRNLSEEIKAVTARLNQLKNAQRKLKADQVEHYANHLEMQDLKEAIKELKQLQMVK